jgi:hypothetical protein
MTGSSNSLTKDNASSDGSGGVYSFLADPNVNSNASSNYNTAFPNNTANNTAISAFMGRCLGSGGNAYPRNNGEKMEIGVAAALAMINPGTTYSARQDGAQGQDIECDDNSGVYFELKYSDQSGGKINTNFSNSPPIVNAVNKYIIFLSSDRAYFIHCPILARMYSFGTDVLPIDTTAEENARFNAGIIHYLVDQQDLRAEILAGLQELYQNTYGATDPEPPTDNDFVDVFITRINGGIDDVKEVFIETLKRMFVVNKGPEAFSPGEEARGTPSKSPVFETIEAAELAFDTQFITNDNLNTSAEIRSSHPVFGPTVWDQLNSLCQQLTVAWGFSQLAETIKPKTPKTLTGPEGSGTPEAGGRMAPKTPTGINWQSILSTTSGPENTPAYKASWIFGFVNNPSIGATKKQDVINYLKANKRGPRLVRTLLRDDNRAVKEMLKEIMRGAYGREKILDPILAVYVERIKKMAIQDQGFKPYNKLLGRNASKHISAYMNQMRAGNEFWTSFERDCVYDGDLYDIFLKDNPRMLNIIQSDSDFQSYRNALESAINSLVDLTQIRQRKEEVISSVKSKYFKDAIAQFEAMLTPAELTKFRIAYDDDKVDFIKQYFADNPTKQNPFRSGHYDIMNVAGQEQRDYDEEMYMSGFDESFKNRSLLDLIVENEEYYEEASNIEKEIVDFEEDQKIQERRRIYELGESHASLLRKKYYGRR